MALDELTTNTETNACNKGYKQMTLDNLTTVQQTDTPANGHQQPVTVLEDIFFLPSDDQQPPLDVKWPDMEKDGANDFTTSLQPIFTPDIRPGIVMNNRAFKIDGLKMLMNDKTGAHLDVKKGQFIKRDHRYFFENVVSALKAVIPLDLALGVKLREDSSFAGGFASWTFTLPNLSGTVHQWDGSESRIELSITAENSHIGTSSKIKVGSRDKICNNSLMLDCDHARMDHTASVNLPDIEEYFKIALSDFPDKTDEFQIMAWTEISDRQVADVLSDTFCKIAPALRTKIWDQYHDEKPMRGPTAWALLAALTTYSSHNNQRFRVRGADGWDNVACTLSKRQEHVARIVSGTAFQSLLK